jgi:hypothetical protein
VAAVHCSVHGAIQKRSTWCGSCAGRCVMSCRQSVSLTGGLLRPHHTPPER